jgi:hypothetical protein
MVDYGAIYLHHVLADMYSRIVLEMGRSIWQFVAAAVMDTRLLDGSSRRPSRCDARASAFAPLP